MKIMVVAVGEPKTAPLAAAIRMYEERIGHYFDFEPVEVRAERISAKADAGRIIDEESTKLLDRVPDTFERIALDRRGVDWPSEKLAAYLADLPLRGRDGVAFLIGGALGLSSELRDEVDRVLSLSSFTLPHELARLVLTEQIYRAGTIHRGEPYHKRG